MHLFKKRLIHKTYDPNHQKPVLKTSICTDEQVEGFKDLQTGKIDEIMLIRSPADLAEFRELYGITEEISKEY